MMSENEVGHRLAPTSMKEEHVYRVFVLAAIYGAAVFLAVVFSPTAGLIAPALNTAHAPVISEQLWPKHG